jgi:cell division protein FtsB
VRRPPTLAAPPWPDTGAADQVRRRGSWTAAVIASVVVGTLFLGVFPARTYLAQRRSLAAAQARVTVLAKQNAALDQESKKLLTDAEIERLAREQYNLVRPGEQAYAILPGPQPAAPPAQAARPAKKHGFWSRAWADITFWH